jgi:hypothetical protein
LSLSFVVEIVGDVDCETLENNEVDTIQNE